MEIALGLDSASCLVTAVEAFEFTVRHVPFRQGLANIFCNEPESKYIKLCRPNYSVLLLEQP